MQRSLLSQQQSLRPVTSTYGATKRSQTQLSACKVHAACQPCLVPQQQRPHHRQQLHSSSRHQQQASRRLTLVHSVQPETEEARSPLDAPQEWEAPQPSKRPDIFPEFEKPERVFLPKPLPGDPEMPDEEEEESKKRTEPGDPDPEAPPGEPSEPEPSEPGGEPEKQPNIPNIPE